MEEESLEEEESSHLQIFSLPGKFNPYKYSQGSLNCTNLGQDWSFFKRLCSDWCFSLKSKEKKGMGAKSDTLCRISVNQWNQCQCWPLGPLPLFLTCHVFPPHPIHTKVILKDVDSLLYVDTDVLFLRPVDDIWKLLRQFNSTQLAAMAPEHEIPKIGWYSRFARHPFYGSAGVNSGVMLMNLTRIRSAQFKVRK